MTDQTAGPAARAARGLAAHGESVRRWLPPALLVLLSAAYYALYLDVGYNFSDEGNYAQVAYELVLGRDLADLPLSYGILWFKLGEAAFRLFGVDYLLVRVIFFACILATGLLVYASVLMVCGRRWFAFAIAAVPALVPAFPPTAFYGLCVLVNAAAQIRLARRLDGPGGLDRACALDAALAGAALALSFQIRPDFGYIFAVPMAVVLGLAVWREDGAGGLGRARRAALLAGAAFAGFAAAHAPSLALSVRDGYLGLLVGQYLSYPALLLGYGLRGVAALLGTGAPADTAAAALLQRPGLDLLAAPDAAAVRLALLVYLPVAVLAGFAAHALIAARRAGRRYAATALVVLTAGAAALPHYFLYRPDLSHIANFMPGYVVLAGVFVWQATAGGRRWALAGTAAAAAVVLNLGLHLWAGLTQEGTGSIAGAAARTERFRAANGVDVRVNAGEKALLEDLKAVIEAHSAPGEAIICVPYCPGIAFMTGRRLLFREYYVDDALPLREPGWIARADALTREKMPPVVIVMDWAINGTDISRFSRWAAPYMETLESLAREKRVRPGLTIYLL